MTNRLYSVGLQLCYAILLTTRLVSRAPIKCNFVTSSFEKRRYRIAGVFISVYLVHGGPTPGFMNQKMFTALVKSAEDIPQITVDDLQEEGREIVHQVNTSNCSAPP